TLGLWRLGHILSVKAAIAPIHATFQQWPGLVNRLKQKGVRMKKYLLAAVCAAAIATPAQARDNQGYVGIEAGVAWVKSQSADVDVTFTPLDVPGGTPLLPAGESFNNIFKLDSHMGYNIGMYGGYDFGVFRLEGEVDWMHANLDQLSIDSDFIDAINSLASPDLIDTGVDIDQASSALAFMLNGLVDIGMRYKYFTTGSLNFHDNTNSFTFLRLVSNVAGAPATQTVLADVNTDL